MDSISAAHSGHLGLPLGAAEIGAVLFGRIMNYNPEDPQVRLIPLERIGGSGWEHRGRSGGGL
jgi:hypothetical protein